MVPFRKQSIIEYIEQRRLPDGGYFFARVEPSSGLDTCLAVRTLRLLSTLPREPDSIAAFWTKRLTEGRLEDLTAISLAVDTFVQLGFSLASFRGICDYVLERLKRPEDYRTDLKSLADLVQLGTNMGLQTDADAIAEIIYSSQSREGGFRDAGGSELSATFHALITLNSLSMPVRNRPRVVEFLSGNFMKGDFLEDLYYIVESLVLINAPLDDFGGIIDFVSSCRRSSGGFSRARVTGISTIEHTYMAVCILRACETYGARELIT